MKQCQKCGKWKPLDGFYKDRAKKDGLSGRCRTCVLAHVHAYRRTEHGQEKMDSYRRSDERKASFQRYNDTEKARATGRKYALSSKGQAAVAAYRKSHPDHTRAGNAVRKRVSRGAMPPPSTLACVHCGQPATSYHHHNGYTKEHRFDVIPLCTRCHRRADRAAVAD